MQYSCTTYSNIVAAPEVGSGGAVYVVYGSIYRGRMSQTDGAQLRSVTKNMREMNFKQFLGCYMKYVIIFLLPILVQCTENHQKGIIVSDGSNRKKVNDSTEIEYFQNGKIKSIRKYHHGKLNYNETIYYENGKIANIHNVKNLQIDGLYLDFFENGDTANIFEYDNGKLINLNSWDQNRKHCVINGNGVVIYYYPDGKIKSIAEFKDLKGNGKCVAYYPNGQLKFERFFDYGRPVGVWKDWYENGKLKKEYNNGK